MHQEQGGTHRAATGMSWDGPRSCFPALSSFSGSTTAPRCQMESIHSSAALVHEGIMCFPTETMLMPPPWCTPGFCPGPATWEVQPGMGTNHRQTLP